MVNPSVLEQLGRQRGREILETYGSPRRAESFATKARQRLGWALIALGAHVAVAGRRRSPWRSLIRP
jgi:hypothetical protein